VKELFIWDDNFTLDINRVEKILDLIIKNNLKVLWQLPNGIRVDRVNKEILTKMKEAGCWSVVLAPETGDPEILKRIEKGFTLDQVRLVNKWCKEINIFSVVFFMLGFPYETYNNALNTYQFVKEIKPDLISVHKFYPFPNTPITKEFNLEIYENKDYRTAIISEEFEKLYQKIYFDFLVNPKNLLNLVKKVGFWNTVRNFYKFIMAIVFKKLRNNDYSL